MEKNKLSDNGTVSRTYRMQLKAVILKKEQKEKVYFIGTFTEDNVIYAG